MGRNQKQNLIRKSKNRKPFLLCSFYRPLSSNADWFDYFSKEIDHAQTECDKFYITGDMNVDCKNGKLSKSKWKHLVARYRASNQMPN